MKSRSVNNVKITHVDIDGQVKEKDDWLAVEEPLAIHIISGAGENRKERPISVTMCTPGNEKELAAGFLYTEGIIQQSADISGVQYEENKSGDNKVVVELVPEIDFDTAKLERHFYTSSSCGVCGKTSIYAVKNQIRRSISKDNFQVDANVLVQLPDTLRKQQEIFEHTGGLHASALFDKSGHLIIVREDVGRHNALDKLIGACLLNKTLPLENHILLLSGRASFELIQKAAMAGIRVVCAVGAPSSLAVELAEENGITLVGFLRNGKFNVYAGRERLGMRDEGLEMRD